MYGILVLSLSSSSLLLLLIIHDSIPLIHSTTINSIIVNANDDNEFKFSSSSNYHFNVKPTSISNVDDNRFLFDIKSPSSSLFASTSLIHPNHHLPPLHSIHSKRSDNNNNNNDDQHNRPATMTFVVNGHHHRDSHDHNADDDDDDKRSRPLHQQQQQRLSEQHHHPLLSIMDLKSTG